MATIIALFTVCFIALAATIFALAANVRDVKLDGLDTFKVSYWARHAR